ncbi:MAG TPA: serine/threonine-protein kinase, partial [Pirellulaceae bacterium]|nr:serine/threonine-protein kinase [Pirellulaceae bacterium]
MICFSEEELRGYLLQEIAAEKQALVEEHIGSCTECRRALDDLAGDDLVRDYFEAFQRDDQSVSKTLNCSEISATTRSRDREDWQPFRGDESRLPIRFSRFLLKEVLGAGGFGIVYRAEDLDLEREVAVKIPHLGRLSPEIRQRFLREGAAAATLHHPNIVQVHQSSTHRDVCFLVSEYCPGPTLKDLLQEPPGTRSPRKAAHIVIPLVEAIAHAHQNGIVHRDIKPANVILDARTKEADLPFCPKLTDFGAARVEGTDQSITASGMLVGTLPYMAPEQIAGDNVGPAGDIYSLGVLLYELTTGQLPIQGSDSVDTLRKVASCEPVPIRRLLPEVSRDFAAICSCCLEKNPAKRYASAEHLADDLRRFLNHEPTSARPLGSAARLLRWSRRNPLPTTIMATICLVFAVISLLFAWHESRLREMNQQLSESNRRALTMKNRAEQSELRALRLQYVSAIRLAAKLWRENDLRSVRDILSSLEPNGQPDLRGVEWYFLERATRQG